MKKVIVFGSLSIAIVPSLLIIAILMTILTIAIIAGGNEENEFENSSFSTNMSLLAENEIPADFIPYYQEAGEKYGINWLILAAVHRQETNFSQNVAVSSAGAIGSLQFMDCTFLGWSYPTCSGLGNGEIPKNILKSPSEIMKYGGYGVDANSDGVADPWNDEDAIHSAANYLSANYKGTTEVDKIQAALFAYNHSDIYVTEVYERFLTYTDGWSSVDGNVATTVLNGKAWPVPFTKNITSSYGQRWGRLHAGIDIAAANISGQPIVALADGVVTRSEYNLILNKDGSEGGWGWYVRINHGNGLETIYAHMNKQGIKVGTQVKLGQVIGYVGNTGGSTGPHLHLETRVNGVALDPMKYIQDLIN
ncbi:transglycosylase protein with SLT domain [Ureibacillus xyleni]|uniref:Transglycosylase protein with SLT domain n=1 Tax=Ureibacillus xyleni TaxID=614648 RepID=A0A285THK9_9BACL|nr:peptidoglycan DD-metalloendopeptidase family protein [Ureibacillus xyleni]SOC21532.1 transglycosylase protein with SLT domain [Ureibacillus xyleni]